MSLSVLEKSCTNEDRPYSQRELKTLHKNLMHTLRIGSVYVIHPECTHGYYCKAGGKKEKEALESNGTIIGNCSVCWKLNRTPRRLKNTANFLSKCYKDKYLQLNPPKSYYDYELELDFYTWLYNEFNPIQKKEP